MSRSSLPPSHRKLLVSEKFVSIQGEGKSTGEPAAFVRLGNCNLKCVYCDTPYTWDESRFDLRAELFSESTQDVAHWVVQNSPGRLILTGGEPLLQQKLLVELLKEIDADWSGSRMIVEIETNGTVLPMDGLVARVDQWNVSPKLSLAGDSAEKRLRGAALELFLKHERSYFKFVVKSPEDLQELDELARSWELPPQKVWLMPEAQSATELRSRRKEVADAALARSYRYSGRLHLELFGGKRGT
jgi:7-carboxy-7-deazaguanine synthase